MPSFRGCRLADRVLITEQPGFVEGVLAVEARLVAQQINVHLINVQTIGNEVTRRDLELLRYCEQLADKFGISMTVAMEEWAYARVGDPAASHSSNKRRTKLSL